MAKSSLHDCINDAVEVLTPETRCVADFSLPGKPWGHEAKSANPEPKRARLACAGVLNCLGNVLGSNSRPSCSGPNRKIPLSRHRRRRGDTGRILTFNLCLGVAENIWFEPPNQVSASIRSGSSRCFNAKHKRPSLAEGVGVIAAAPHKNSQILIVDCQTLFAAYSRISAVYLYRFVRPDDRSGLSLEWLGFGGKWRVLASVNSTPNHVEN